MKKEQGMNGGNSASIQRLARRLRRQHYRLAELEKSAMTAAATGVADPAAPGNKHQHGHPTEADKQLDRLRDQLARTQAEFDNYRKRQRREEKQHIEAANQRLIEQLLPVLDNFNRAMVNPGESVQGLLDGITMVQKQLTDALNNNGLEKIEALGQTFDPNVHEAVSTVPPEDGQTDNQVVEVYQDGYKLKGRLVRPAMVKVARS